MADPYWRYAAPADRATIPRPVIPGYPTSEASTLPSRIPWPSHDRRSNSSDYLHRDVDSGECFRVVDNPNITLHYNTETVDVVSNTKGQMSGIKFRNLDSGEESVIEAKGLFYGISHSPNSQLLQGQVDLDDFGYILVKDGNAKTSVEGVFAAGDVQDHEWRQAINAAGSGCITLAALSVERYLPHTEEVQKELTPRDVQEGFDITLTKHKGQVIIEFDQNVHFVEIDIEEDPEVSEAANIMGTPCVQFFKNKGMIRNVAGVKMKKEAAEKGKTIVAAVEDLDGDDNYEMGEDDLKEAQNSVARLIQMLYNDDPREVLKIIHMVKKHIMSGGPKRLPFTIPSLIYNALKETLSATPKKIFQLLNQTIEVLSMVPAPDLALRLYLECAEAANDCDLEPLGMSLSTQEKLMVPGVTGDSKDKEAKSVYDNLILRTWEDLQSEF
ncbi:hypothetical protein LXL04_011502 [Taraxacum kok-saghyz]